MSSGKLGIGGEDENMNMRTDDVSAVMVGVMAICRRYCLIGLEEQNPVSWPGEVGLGERRQHSRSTRHPILAHLCLTCVRVSAFGHVVLDVFL
jgi:hypothetical protein